jgi:hypothetical protein|tara:strand:+ start:225 stop:659 length:435 start_codon:yes stop_codon:yes gene_type:complete
MTSKSRFDLNEVGNKATHDKHVVALEPSDSVFMRGRIKDQLFIDHLLMNDVITMEQHASGERFLQLAVSASVYLTSPNFAGVGGGGVRSNTTMYSSGLMKWHRAEKNVRKKWGDEGVIIIHDHIVLDVWTNDDLKIELLISILT